jgi:mono/diheme cytochrome c family protein
MRRAATLVALAVALVAGTSSAQAPDAGLGGVLYARHCSACHTPKVHRRVPSAAIDRDALRFIVQVWSEERGLGWTGNEIEAVVRYLDESYYALPR